MQSRTESRIAILSLTVIALLWSVGIVQDLGADESDDLAAPPETPVLSSDDFDEVDPDAVEALNADSESFDEPNRLARSCVAGICAGDRVRILRGPLYGFTGLVTFVDRFSQRVSVVTDTGSRVRLPVRTPPQAGLKSTHTLQRITDNVACLWNFCRGDQAKVAGGTAQGFRGYVRGFDRERELLLLQRTHSGPTVPVHAVFVRHARW